MSHLPVGHSANNLDLTQFAGGALQEKINIEMDKLTRNINDPGTDAKIKRKIVIEISMTPDAERELIQTETSVKTTLAPIKGVNTKMVMAADPQGRPVLKELNTKPTMSGKGEIIEMNPEVSQGSGFNRYNQN